MPFQCPAVIPAIAYLGVPLLKVAHFFCVLCPEWCQHSYGQLEISLFRWRAERTHNGRGDAPAVVLPALVDLREDLGQAEPLQETNHGPCRVELAAEGGELRGGRTRVVVVVQALSESDQSQESEIRRVVREALVAEGVARAVDRGVEHQVHDRECSERHETGPEAYEEDKDHARQGEA